MKVYDNLMSSGYYLGNSTEIFTDKQILNIRRCINEDIDYQFQNSETNNWTYNLCCKWPDSDGSRNKPIKPNQISEKLEQIKKESAEITQSWYYKQYVELKEIPINKNEMYDRLNSYIGKVYNLDIKSISIFPHITYYTKNDFIAVHKDGETKNRICALLIYLADPDHYKKEYGGKLLLQPAFQNKSPTTWDYNLLPVHISPTSNNMIIIDFTVHNIFHAVEKCNYNFYRAALLAFFHLN